MSNQSKVKLNTEILISIWNVLINVDEEWLVEWAESFVHHRRMELQFSVGLESLAKQLRGSGKALLMTDWRLGSGWP